MPGALDGKDGGGALVERSPVPEADSSSEEERGMMEPSVGSRPGEEGGGRSAEGSRYSEAEAEAEAIERGSIDRVIRRG